MSRSRSTAQPLRPLRTVIGAELPGLVLGLAAFAMVAAEVDVGGDYPSAWAGSGLTLDESFNVQQGVYLCEAIRVYGIGLFAPESVQEVFSEPAYLADHPPLGRLWLGGWHNLIVRFFPTAHPDQTLIVSAARVGTAAAFGMLVWLVVGFATRWTSSTAGWLAGLSLMAMPRLFGHAHLAALDLLIALAWFAAIERFGQLANLSRPPRTRSLALAGFVFGLALLTKIQAVLLPIPVGLWALWRWRWLAFRPVVAWGLIGVATMFVCWPWLWLDPIAHGMSYLARTTDRVELFTWYGGARFADRDVPWHYSMVMFLATMPVGIVVAGLVGAVQAVRTRNQVPVGLLVVVCLLFPIAVFSVPGTAVYDGIRLFLVCSPLWAVLSGQGAAWMYERLRRSAVGPGRAGLVLSVLVLSQFVGLVTSRPSYLSYYNLLVGGSRGAQELGFESTYWSDCLTRSFWQQVPEDSTILVAPVLHQFYLPALSELTPIIRARRIRLEPFYYGERPQNPAPLLLIHRLADLPARYHDIDPAARVIAEVKQDGVLLAILLDPRTAH